MLFRMTHSHACVIESPSVSHEDVNVIFSIRDSNHQDERFIAPEKNQ